MAEKQQLYNTSINMADMLDKQSVPVEGDKNVRASPLMLDEPIAYLDEEAQTLHGNFLRGLKVSKNGPCLGRRPSPKEQYEWITYQQVLDRSQRFGSGLIAEGAETNTSQFIGIFSQNRVEWKVVEQACNSFSMVVVPLYDTLGPQSIEHIINQCELRIIVIDNNKKARELMRGVEEKKFILDVVVIMEEPEDEVRELAEKVGVKLKTFLEVESKGQENMKDFVPPKPNDLHTICYTSGTTGLPKGAMLTHKNVIANYAGLYCIGRESFFKLSSDDVHISFLPLAHVFERIIQALIFFVGGRVGYFQGNVKLLLDDVGALKPTTFPMVPRLMNRVYDTIWSGAAQSGIKNFLLKRATKAKMKLLKKRVVSKDTLWDSLVFRKVQNRMGGRLRLCVSGAAPVSLEVINFMRCALGVDFSEGYGQTEATAGISFTLPGDFFSGSVGSPAVCNVIKLVDVSEKNYTAKDGKGEVCVKGANVFKGYYKDEEKTKEALDEEGWLHTGDIGMWLPNGSLKIIDRKKHIFKLAQGEYIAPEKIEGVLVQSQAVAQVFVHGESLKASLVAIVIPDPDNFATWCASKGMSGNYETLCGSEEANKLVLEDMCAIGRKRGLHAFELPRKISFSTEMFSVENNLLTPTFKSRRPQIHERYKDVIEKLYEGLD